MPCQCLALTGTVSTLPDAKTSVFLVCGCRLGGNSDEGAVMTLLADVSDVYLHREAVDFRKSINGLVLIVEQEMCLSPFSDALFVFCNKSRDKLKAVYWDKTGFCLWYKRLEKERFQWPRKRGEAVMTLTETQWNALLEGLSIEGHKTLQFTSAGG